jgi:hypothetical protein
MTQDEIIEMAKKAGLGFLDERNWMYQDELETFAKLVASKYEQEIQDLKDEILNLMERQDD